LLGCRRFPSGFWADRARWHRFPFLLASLVTLVFAILKAGACGAWAGVVGLGGVPAFAVLASSFLAHHVAGHVAGTIAGTSGGSNGTISVVLGMLVPLALLTGSFLLEGYFLEGLASVGLALAGGYLGGRVGERFGRERA
jgi:hypothetical protein